MTWYRCGTIGTILLLSLAAWPASAQEQPRPVEISRIVAAEVKSRIQFLVSLQGDCSSSGRTTVRVLEPPQHGKLTIEYGQATSGYPKDSQLYNCNTRKSDGVLIFYESHPEYLGPDSVTLYAIFPSGNASKYHHSIDVK
jgi:hypothetical protein